MDATLLTNRGFWDDPAPAAGIPELAGHVLFETSGSSGDPKQVAISKKALLASAEAVNRHLSVGADSCWGLALPLHHVGGFGVAARAHEAGCRFSRLDGKWTAAGFRGWIEADRITHTSLVPTQVFDLVKEKLQAPKSLCAIVVGGGHLDPATGQAARDLGWPVLASYGMTEAGSQIATQGLDELHLPFRPFPIPLLPIWEARISPENRLEIAGPALFSGYLAAGKFTPRAADWHTTSDVVELDRRMLTPLGRADTLVKILGELVDPESIERKLIALSNGQLEPGSFAIVPVSDERAGARLVPVFLETVDRELIGRILAAHDRVAPGFQRLQPARRIDGFPKGDLGKLRRRELAGFCESLKLAD